jgi:hypothetical protein
MRANRRDGNEREVVAAFRGCGCFVVPVNGVGFDLLVGLTRGRGWVCVEVKDGELAPSRRVLTPAERVFSEVCRSRGLPYLVVTSVDEAVDLANAGNRAGV